MPDVLPASFITDAPDPSTFAGAEPDAAPPTSRIQVAKCGSFKHSRYGSFKVTAQTFDSFAQNFAAGVPTDRLPIDRDHEPDKGGSTAAQGWITQLHPEDGALFATVEWTPAGVQALKDRMFRFISPTWSLNFTDETGERRGPTLLGAALTSRPFFRMPAVSLSRCFATDFPDLELIAPLRDAVRGEPSEQQVAVFADLVATHLAVAGVPLSQTPNLANLLARMSLRIVDPAAAPATRLAPDRLLVLAGEMMGDRWLAARVPPELRDPPADVETDRERLDRRARALAAGLGINYAVAGYICEADDELAEAEADTGAASEEWLDTSKPLPVRPYGEENASDLERDKRRATAAGVDVAGAELEAAYEQGEDLVYVRAAAARAARVEQARAARDQLLRAARDAARRRAAS